MKYIKDKMILRLAAALLVLLFSWSPARASHGEDENFEAGPFIIEHVVDSYGWHICGSGDKSVTIPLPIILIDDGHLTVFMSGKFHHGEAAYKGYALGWGDDKGSIVKLRGDHAGYTGPLEEGAEYDTEVCRWDLSITKNVCALFVSIVLIVCIFLTVAKSYKRHPDEAPSGLQALVEPVIVFLQEEVFVPSLGDKSDKYSPYLLTLFFFILINNLMGIVPIFPGGANLTGNIVVTGVLALITFFVTNLSGKREYWIDIVNTPGVPWWLKVPIPLMPLVEIIGLFTKPFVLMVRLFANITAGHIVVLGFVSLIFIFGQMAPALGYAVSVVSVFFYIFMGILELLVAFIQAFVFTLLSSIYIGMAVGGEEHEAAAA
ncbi:MAG: F0F1 ATP synthase subunit A [Bacteroidales bacterium]|nr:F0F1 ATP synthase subunit A [Bacteroidales bacterium]MDY6347919.1 F0F1 ATP synthase subunit A [Bacteroidales bacterium]